LAEILDIDGFVQEVGQFAHAGGFGLADRLLTESKKNKTEEDEEAGQDKWFHGQGPIMAGHQTGNGWKSIFP